MRIACIFAHPDDEAFGPGGTIASLAEKNDVYVFCATRGEAGQDDQPRIASKKLGKIRSEELRQSAKILGVKKVSFLGFRDGCLCNKTYHNIVRKLINKLAVIKPQILLTFEPRGRSGHIDHITVSMVTTYIFDKLPEARELWYYCLSDNFRKMINDYFIYFPPGYKKKEVNKVINVEKEWEKKIAAIKAHKSQSEDVQQVLKLLKKLPKEEYFLIVKKKYT